ncbi:hypothetical protein [Mesonia sp. K4-1]|uniref:hypothetical protein n=1 Tax=Mesonia sp. K4-1 TaxID=2602760 RepID=UPI0011C9BD8A|nr:hypothetical protein [Mesonia sp. K4-1]TXK71900.1 hypothetical protein FT986_15655 [Mesonia sp. K4-1]
MNNIKKTKLYTILFHSLIIIGAGHGIGIMGIFDVIGIIQIPEIYKNGIIFNINGDYQDRLSLVVIFSIIGKIILITSLFLNKNLIKNLITLIGIIILWISVYFLTSGNWYYDWLYGFSFLTSIPFLIYSIKLIRLIIENIKQNKKLNINVNEK